MEYGHDLARTRGYDNGRSGEPFLYDCSRRGEDCDLRAIRVRYHAGIDCVRRVGACRERCHHEGCLLSPYLYVHVRSTRRPRYLPIRRVPVFSTSTEHVNGNWSE